MRSLLLLPLAALTLVAAQAADAPAKPMKPPTPDSLVDSVIRVPGEFSQMCDSPAPVPAKLPLYVYGMVRDRELALGPEQLAALHARRAEVVPVLVARLKAMDLSKPGKPLGDMKFKPEDEIVENSGLNPRALSGPFYEMIVKLDAVETLPELLRLEEQLRSLLAAADADAKKPVPSVPMDGTLVPPQGDAKLSKRDEKMLEGRAVQRELLSVMLQLLRGQRYAPLLASDLEATYAAATKARAQKEDLATIKTPADAKAQQMEYIKFDPILGVPLGYMEKPITVPFTPESRNQVRGFVQDFLKNVPAKDWKVNPPPPVPPSEPVPATEPAPK
jgi:hypothetical protein